MSSKSINGMPKLGLLIEAVDLVPWAESRDFKMIPRRMELFNHRKHNSGPRMPVYDLEAAKKELVSPYSVDCDGGDDGWTAAEEERDAQC